MSRRRMRTQAEWKVAAQMSLASGPNFRSNRSFSSPAALLVKVIARTVQGAAGFSLHSSSIRLRSLSSGALRKASRAFKSPSVTQVGTSVSAGSEALPYLMRFATRLMRTVVLPLPAPASRRSGPSVVRTP